VTWFSPARWSANDKIIAVAALVLAVSVFVPWFRASVRIRGAAINGSLIQPQGTVSGIAVHGYLWAVFGLALLEFAVLAARYIPRPRSFRVPRYRELLVAASAVSCFAVLVAALMKPNPWDGGNDLGGGFYIVVTWAYGAFIGASAAIVALGIAVSAVRDRL
jgi:hypothetical protein